MNIFESLRRKKQPEGRPENEDGLHRFNIRSMERAGFMPLNYNQITKGSGVNCDRDFLLADKNIVSAGEYNVWCPGSGDDNDLIVLTPCSLFGGKNPGTFLNKEAITIGKNVPYFSLIIFPTYTDKEGKKVTLSEYRDGTNDVGYEEEVWAISPYGILVPHYRNWTKLFR